jgi:hypothetical protein
MRLVKARVNGADGPEENARRTAERLHVAVAIFHYETEFAAPR